MIPASMPRYLFSSGPWRGTELIAEGGALRHQGTGVFEVIPLRQIGSVRVAYDRDGARMGWGFALLVAAFLIFVVTGSVASLTGTAAREVGSQLGSDGGQGFGSVLLATFRGLEHATVWLPIIALLLGAIGAVALLLGAWGRTTLTLTVAGFEREFHVRGRNTQMIDFAEALGGHLANAAP